MNFCTKCRGNLDNQITPNMSSYLKNVTTKIYVPLNYKGCINTSERYLKVYASDKNLCNCIIDKRGTFNIIFVLIDNIAILTYDT